MNNHLKIGFCGDVCSECPRYIYTQTNDLKGLEKTAELWFRLGFRDKIVDPEELKCNGCNREMYCSHQINKCEHLETKKNCGECFFFSCNKLNAIFQKVEKTREICKERCSEKEYQMLDKVFFQKKKILTDFRI